MKIYEFISEITKPVGTIYLRFKERMGDVPPNASKEEKAKAMYLTAFAGFANNPDELTFATSRLKFHKLTNMEDIVKMIKTIMSDKVFISAKKMTVYMDLSNSAFSRHPYLSKFLDWAGKNAGDRIKIEWKPPSDSEEEGPKKKKKPNPMLGKKIRDVDAADPKFTVTFGVDDRFYREIDRNLPNLMKYRGPGRTFVMPNELFMQFRNMAKERFPNAEIKILKKAHTDESFIEDDMTDEGGPASRALCLSKRSDKSLGASQLASCRSQGLRSRKGGKSHKIGNKRVKVGGKKIKGKAHGGPLPDWS